MLLAGDESAIPALAGILRDIPADSRGIALVEIEHDEERQELPHPPGVELRWIVRDGRAVGTPLLAELERLAFPSGVPVVFAVGERTIATGVRRHAIHERGVPRHNVTFSGYWRVGRAAG